MQWLARSTLENTRGLYHRLREEYDLVIIDTPPILAVSDAMALSTQADATLFAVRWGMTPRAAVKLGLRRLLGSSHRPTVAGIVLTMVNTREHSRCGYEDLIFCTKELVDYYSSIKRNDAGAQLKPRIEPRWSDRATARGMRDKPAPARKDIESEQLPPAIAGVARSSTHTSSRATVARRSARAAVLAASGARPT